MRTGATVRSGRSIVEAIEDMFERTDHAHAPWQLVEANDKRYARVKVVETVIAEVERGMRERGFPVPPAA